MKRSLDLILSCILITLLFFPCLLIAILIKLTSDGTVIYWSKRVGKNENIFLMPKFRTMKSESPEKATHLLEDPEELLTPIGGFLRNSSIDEIPQLICTLKGDLSFVGPRPALYNQSDLITLRRESGVHTLVPGITGWAQVNGRDELSIIEKVNFDKEYLSRRSLFFDLYIIWLTFIKVIKRQNISH